MSQRYFAYGSNMNPERVRDRGLVVLEVQGARLAGVSLAFDKSSRLHEGVGHANIVFDPGGMVEGVLYLLAHPHEIVKMDRFENTPHNYSRQLVTVETAGGRLSSWTYIANPAVRREQLRPPRSYLNHLLAGRPYLSADYYRMLESWECMEDR